ncbi:S8 family peptidase [Bacillus changyiensis]|uniref:S8 family peptidase n=1 Tax=Bacillus changyiensis TaxID=3004103 RepID=UPI0022E5C63E|nr:S8 family serine peptidase [Bacillus changyiensis]MDA1477774.1 S8 family serine peptidase [Bacillus changyiensis]
MKNVVFTLILLLLLVSCSNNYKEITLSKSDCQKNWALCSIFPNGKAKLYSSQDPIKVALLDSGVSSSLPIFKNSSITTYDSITNKPTTTDSLGHGTAIASIIMAPTNKHTVQGVSPKVKLFDVKVLNDKGGGDVNDVINGINWSIKQDVDIINLSFGFQKDDNRLKSAINKAIENDIIVIASAGNTLGLSTDYPARYQNVISISSINKKLKRDPLAAKGKIDFVAPGVQIPVITPKGELKTVNGTSFATAYVTGVVSNILSEHPEFEREDVLKVLKSTAKDLGKKGPDKEYGYGLIQYN